MGNTVQKNLMSSLLRTLDCLISGIAVKQHIEFRNLGNPTPIDLSIQCDRQPHILSLSLVLGFTGKSPDRALVALTHLHHGSTTAPAPLPIRSKVLPHFHHKAKGQTLRPALLPTNLPTHHINMCSRRS